MKKLIFALLLLPSIASAWGGTGHEIVCEIAFQELTSDARNEVVRLINLDTEYNTFSASCRWADRPRKRGPDHYLNVPRSQITITSDECPLADSCLFPAIEKDIKVLSDNSQSDQQRLEALKFLGHWVGDIHQPMHVSYQDDRGANDIKTHGLCAGNLHGAWDGCMIEREMGKDSGVIANRLLAGVSDADRLSWQSGSSIEWADESYQITIRPETGYCFMRQGACWYSDTTLMLIDGDAQRAVTIDQLYLTMQRKTIELRLKQAGIRLGAVINQALN